MVVSVLVSPPHSLLLVMDSLSGDIPQSMRGKPIASTESRIAVGCRSEDDGETEIILGSTDQVDPGRSADFEGYLETPSRRVAVRSVHGGSLLEVDASKEETIVRIWVNDRSELD